MIKPLFAMAALALGVPMAGGAQTRVSAVCDKSCLSGLADSYVAAMVAHDPKRVPLAKAIVTVENLSRIQPGGGLWKTASAVPTTFKIVIPDPITHQVGLMTVMMEDGKPIQLGLRLKVEGGQVVEAEHIVVRNLSANSLKNLQTPRAAFHQPVPTSYREHHDQLLRIAASYYDALDENNGRLAPFADDCVRIENGFQTSRNAVPADRMPSAAGTTPAGGGMSILGALGCEAQLDTGAFQYIDKIDDRRVFAADEETGLAVGFSHFHHPMTQKIFRIYGVPGMETRDMSSQRLFDMPAMHIYKIWGGKLHEIEALGVVMPLNSKTGWEK